MSDSHEPAGFVAPEPADLAPLFPGYDIQGLIATGGMGAVYRAVQRSLDRTVALKILPMEFSQDAAFCAGFEAEAKAMARLNHPNLIGVFDFGEVNGMLFIIMEYVPGQSVYHSAYGQAIDQKEVIRLVSGICDGLAHAHENGIIHRDIKPSNILLDLNTQPKIGDFGLARPMDRKIEEGEEIFGTPHYTAPEVVNSPHSVDYRADIFSVGVLLHELLTGKLPAQDPRPPSAIIHCDARFDNIVKKATRPLPAARYSNAAEISKELQAIATSLEQKSRHVAPAAAPRRVNPGRSYSAKPEKSGSSTMVLLLIAGVAGVAAYSFLSKKPPAKSEAPVVVVPQASPEPPVVAEPPKPAVQKEPEVAQNTTPAPTTSAFGSTEAPVLEGQPTEATASSEAPAATPVVAPKADVAGFFVRARGIMQGRAKSLISTYRMGLNGNSAEFSRAVATQLRKAKLSGEPVDKSLETTVSGLKNAGGKIPEKLESPLSGISGIQGIHDEYVQRQVGVEDTFQQGLSQLSGTYILGIEKQIERYKTDSDPGAVSLLEKEIERTKASPKYFADLMLGVDPESSSGSGSGDE